MLQDLIAAGPIVVVSVSALLVLLAEAAWKKPLTLQWWISLTGLAVGGVTGGMSIPVTGTAFGGMLTIGGAAGYWCVVFCAAGFLCLLLSPSYLIRQHMQYGEYYTLLLFGVVGMMLMASSGDLIIFFLGLELMSISFYVLTGFARTRLTSNEASLKYFLLGAFATGFLLYGIALLYGTFGTTSIASIMAGVAAHAHEPLLMIGLALLLVGLSFKVAAVPFHMWVPDVYEGAPTTVSAFMSTGGKAAAFSVLLIIFTPALVKQEHSLREVLAVVSGLSMVVGNLLAIAQRSIKRMLAYSSVAHAGYILSGVVAANATGSTGVLFYLLAYTMMNAGAFGVLSLEESPEGTHLTYDDYAGFGKKKPLTALLMSVFMFSLAGVPPFAGFFGKYYVFAGAVAGGYTWLAILGVVMSVVSAYYYLRLVVKMYFEEGSESPHIETSLSGMTAIVAAALALLGLGVLPSVVLSAVAKFF